MILFGLLSFHLLLLIATRFTAWPEMLFWPYLLLKGWLPYKDIGIAHSPLLVWELTAFYKLSGIGVWQQKIISWVFPIVTDLFIYFFFSKLFKPKKAIITLFFYIFFQIYYDGNGIWFDHALALLVILLYYLLEKKKIFFASLIWMIAILTKQTAFWFFLPILFYFIRCKEKKKFINGFIQGVALSGTVFVLALMAFGLLKNFLNWAVIFGIFQLPREMQQIRLPGIRILISSLAPYLIFLPMAIQKNKKYFPLLIWTVAGSMGALPRFELFHFQPALPFLALAYSIQVENSFTQEKINKFVFYPTLLILVIVITMVARGLIKGFRQPARFHGDNDQKIVEKVSILTTPNQTIFITNYWDNLYSLSGTLPAIRPFVPQLPQYISQPGIEDNVVRDLERNRPKVVVRGKFDSATSVYRFEKINAFIDNNYRTTDSIGGIDILEPKNK